MKPRLLDLFCGAGGAAHGYWLAGFDVVGVDSRHRAFKTNWSGVALAHPCQHRRTDYAFDHGAKQPESVYRDAMGCDWMSVIESRDAIPPAYTEFIGTQLLAHVRVAA